MKGKLVLLFALQFGLMLAIAGLTGAQDRAAPLGSGFTYQGELSRGDEPVAGPCDFQFGLWDAGSAGTQVGITQTIPGVPLDDGLFSVLVNAGGEFGAGPFAGEARWLAVMVQCPGDPGLVSLGRQALTAAPYAHYAGSAPWAGLAGVPAGLDDGDDDTTYTPGAGLELVGTQFGLLAGYQLPQGCTDGALAQASGGSWVCGGGGAYWSLIGNSGTTPGTHFLGTTDSAPLELRVSGTHALRLEPTGGSPNLIGGYGGNSVTAGVAGASIGGGGMQGAVNGVYANYGVVGGGIGNAAYGELSAVAGGERNAAGSLATVGGGGYNHAQG